ncbi:restriction endonuclease [Clostridium butyricum]
MEFEEYLKNIFERLDYSVERIKTTGNQGVDLIIIKGNLKKYDTS